MSMLLTSSASPVLPPPPAASSRARFRVAASADAGAAASAGVRRGGGASSGFPSFLPPAVERIRDGDAIRLAKRIERTGFSKTPILSSCVRPLEQQQEGDPVVLLHGFDSYSSCLEWRYTYPLLEEAGLEAWAVDILGWGFSDLEARPPCDVASKREHLYQVSKLIFIGASVYTEGPKHMTRMPKFVPYAGVSILKSLPLRLLATRLAFKEIPGGFYFDWVQRLHQELLDATLRMVGQCGHIPHVEKPREAAKYVIEFLERDKTKVVDRASVVTSALALTVLGPFQAAAEVGDGSMERQWERFNTVRRVIYTASVVAASPFKEDDSRFKDVVGESCWTPFNLSYGYRNEDLRGVRGGDRPSCAASSPGTASMPPCRCSPATKRGHNGLKFCMELLPGSLYASAHRSIRDFVHHYKCESTRPELKLRVMG
ncbi:hypothetical protein PR202_gb21542 [Eleusine coracana subsp. coracana]|uniref:Uncharacterized protein n=1 Tax=Eleusine coracana subsp. coracana TaxID=191504 RepID=A0AAV5FDH2_ELECO|nr:hypothetical protein PR202_gb21542 [Eleusine coracana subsp. coracana]